MSNKVEMIELWLRTFSMDQGYADALARSQTRLLSQLLAQVQWCHRYYPSIQRGLLDAAALQFASVDILQARAATMGLTGAIARDIQTTTYLAIRGVLWDAGLSQLRRATESLGVLCHFWATPEKVASLDKGADARSFKNAFEQPKNQAEADSLKERRVKKRFAACEYPDLLSRAYEILSDYAVHGGGLQQLVGVDLSPTTFSCALVNRPEPGTDSTRKVLQLASETSGLILRELCALLIQMMDRHEMDPTPELVPILALNLSGSFDGIAEGIEQQLAQGQPS